MSAYGAISTKNRPQNPLPSTIWNLKNKSGDATTARARYITIHHLTLETASSLGGLVPYLHQTFAEELERGLTYPQEILQGETYTQASFEAYFFAADVLIGIISDPTDVDDVKNFCGMADATPTTTGIGESKGKRSWVEAIAGVYYVKPNYPGRSSHICNAGFLIPSSQRGQGLGLTLGRSYLYYAPRLGYEASVFNLVYVNNIASVRIWESLDFTKAGRIPRAGRLKKADSSEEEEYVDAWVFYKRFEDVSKS